jgi:LysR family glycine cleavage system transcriptional activator
LKAFFEAQMNFRKKLPSLTALVALEATIRHRSVTAAAKELGVTQAAVSRLVALLEEDFGRPLFNRGHRAIEPTPACLIFGATLADGFSDIADGVEALRGNKSDVVTIGATIAFSSLWLLPKLAEFRSKHSGVQIRVISQEGKFAMDTGEVDMVFHYGLSSPSGTTAIASSGDRIFPVCAPEYKAKHSISSFPSGSYDLIETDFSSRSWVRWADWFG